MHCGELYAPMIKSVVFIDNVINSPVKIKIKI